MVRVEVRMPEAKIQRLKEMAKERGMSLSAFVRETLDAYVRRTDPDVIRRAREAVGFVSSGDTDVSVRHDDYDRSP